MNTRWIQVDNPPCTACGVLQGIPELDNSMWDIYNRHRDGRANYEPLVFDSEWLQENVQDEEDVAAVNNAMSKDMNHRGLCIKCGRPDLRGVAEADILTEEESREMADMYAEQAAERRAGC